MTLLSEAVSKKNKNLEGIEGFLKVSEEPDIYIPVKIIGTELEESRSRYCKINIIAKPKGTVFTTDKLVVCPSKFFSSKKEITDRIAEEKRKDEIRNTYRKIKNNSLVRRRKEALKEVYDSLTEANKKLVDEDLELNNTSLDKLLSHQINSVAKQVVRLKYDLTEEEEKILSYY